MPAVDLDRVAAMLPRYTLGAELGAGSFGLVLAAHHLDLDRAVAVKVLPAGGDGSPAVADFRAEARVLSMLDHPHIVRIYDYIGQDDLCLIIMEMLGGGTLAERRLRPEDACAVGLAVADALAHAHDNGVLHRDIKPANILFTPVGQPKVADFGIGKIFDGEAGTVSRVVGTPSYMAPEQINGGRMGPAADLYALGTVLYELLTGRTPFDPRLSLPELLRRQCQVEPEEPVGVPEPVAEVVLRALAKPPAARQPNVRAFFRDLAAAAADAYGQDWRSRSGVVLRIDEQSLLAGPVPGAGFVAAPGLGDDHTTRTASAVLSGEGAEPADPADSGDPVGLADSVDSAEPAAPTEGSGSVETSSTGADWSAWSGAGSEGGRPSGRVMTAAILAVVVIVAAAVTIATVVNRGYRSDQTANAAAPSPDQSSAAAAGPAGRGQPAHVTDLGLFTSMSGGPRGDLYLADRSNHRVLRVDPDGSTTIVAGTGTPGSAGDGGAATQAQLRNPTDVGVDAAGNLYILDEGNQRIRKVDGAGVITTIAGAGSDRDAENMPAAEAELSFLSAFIAVDASGDVYFGEPDAIRRIDRQGVITTVALVGEDEDATDDTGAADADAALGQKLPRVDQHVSDLAVHNGRLYLASYEPDRVQVLDPDGMVRTLAGTGTQGFAGDGGPAVAAELDLGTDVSMIAVDSLDTVYIADKRNHRVRRVDQSGTINTVAGMADNGSYRDNVPATTTRLQSADMVAVVDDTGAFYIGGAYSGSIRRVDSQGIITTIVG